MIPKKKMYIAEVNTNELISTPINVNNTPKMHNIRVLILAAHDSVASLKIGSKIQKKYFVLNIPIL